MVTTPDEQQADKEFDRYSRNTFNAGLIIAIASSIIVIGTLLLQTLSGNNYYAWVTAVAAGGGIIAMILARRGHSLVGSVILIVSLFSIAAFYVITFEVIATMMVIMIIIISLGIAIQTIPSQKLGWAIVTIVLAGVGLILLDLFWPTPRAVPPLYSESIILFAGAFTILLMTVVIIRQFLSFSLRGKLIGATLAVALIAVAAVAFGVSIFTTQAITTEVGENLNTITGSQSLAIAEFLSRKVNTLEALSTNNVIIQGAQANNAQYEESEDSPEKQIAIVASQWPRSSKDDEPVKSILESDISAELNRFQELFPDNTQLLVTDKYGGQIGATRRTRDYFKGDEAWWQETYVDGFGSVYIGNPNYDSETRTYSVIMAVPIHAQKENGGGEIAGVIQAIVSFEALSDILLNARFGETGVIEIVIDEFNHLIVEDNGDIRVSDTYLDPEALSYVRRPTDSFILTEIDETPHFLSAVLMNTLTHEPAIDFLRWSIISTQHEEEILAPVEQQQRINTILGIFVVLSAGAVAAYVGQQISKPITDLTKVVEEVASGNFEVQAEVTSKDEIGVLATSFNVMTEQLRESITTLEQRVQNRTQALATTVEVGRQLSTILNENELLTAVVNQVRDSFDYYQAQIYLLADDQQTLVMASGTGKAGQEMLANDHTLPMGVGLVGRAADTNMVILVPDTSREDGWLANPLLPDTKAETAVPIAIGNDVLGVLDVQHNIVNGLQQEDADLLQSVANQVAVALRNARLYKETQQRAQNEALLRSINQKISSTTDMETAMKVAIRELGEALGTKQTIVRLGHHQTTQPSLKTNGNTKEEDNT